MKKFFKIFNTSTILGFVMFLLTVGYYLFAKPENMSADTNFLATLIYWSFITISNLLLGLILYAIQILRNTDYQSEPHGSDFFHLNIRYTRTLDTVSKNLSNFFFKSVLHFYPLPKSEPTSALRAQEVQYGSLKYQNISIFPNI